MKEWLSKLTKRKFAFPFGTALFFVICDGIGLDLSLKTMSFVTGLVALFVVPEYVADIKKLATGAKKGK